MAVLPTFEKRLENIVSQQNSYHIEAYLLVLEALDSIFVAQLTRQHVSGATLLQRIKGILSNRFGPMSVAVLRAWGIKNSLDFGRIVFMMVGAGILKTAPEDSLKDFEDEHFFQSIFDVESQYRLDNHSGLESPFLFQGVKSVASNRFKMEKMNE